MASQITQPPLEGGEKKCKDCLDYIAKKRKKNPTCKQTVFFFWFNISIRVTQVFVT